MSGTFLEGILAWVETYPQAALALVFAASLGESLFMFGMLVPGGLLMFAAGALVGADALPLGLTVACGAAGAIIGDSASFVLGRAYRGHLHALPGLSRHPELVARGEAFFARHGGKGVILGRLFGWLRPVMPTVAGASGLSVRRFIVVDLIAVLAWVPCYILPGVVFGASLDLAAQVGMRLAIVMIAVVAIVWGVTWAARFMLAAGRLSARRYAERLIAWSRRHRRLGLLGPALADPRQPELPALAVAASLLFFVTAAIYLGLWGWQPPAFPRRFDALAFYLIQGLHTPVANTLAGVILELGSPLIYMPFAVVVGIVLAGLGNWRAAGHWLAALTFSALVVLTLRYLLAIPTPVTFFYGAQIDPLTANGGQDLILCATVYGLTGAILSQRQPPGLRPYYYSAGIAWGVLIALARLYLGLAWASDVIVALSVTFIWLNMLVLCYRRQRPRAVRPRPVFTALAVAVAIALVIALWPAGQSPWRWPHPESAPVMAIADWTDAGYTMLDARISDMAGRPSAPLNLQAAGGRHDLTTMLARAGWRPPPAFDAAQTLRWLDPDADIQMLPVLPRIHDGQRAAITRVRSDDSTSRWVLRLWPTGAAAGEASTPLWVGLVDRQRVDRRMNLMATAADQHLYASAAQVLAATLAAHNIGHRWTDGAQPRLLFWTPAAQVDATVAPE